MTEDVEKLIKDLEKIEDIEFIWEYRIWRPFGVEAEEFSAAVQALGEIGDKRAITPLAAALDSDKQWFDEYHGMFTEEIARALVKIGINSNYATEWNSVGSHLFSLLDVALEGNSHYEYIDPLDVAELICEIGCYTEQFYPLIDILKAAKDVDLLSMMLVAEEEEIRESAAEVLDGFGWEPKTDEQRLFFLLGRGDIEAIVKWGEPAVNLLIKKLDYLIDSYIDPMYAEQDSHSYVIDVLGQIGDARAVEPLIKALGAGNLSAARALGQIGDAAVEPLIKALGAGNSYAARALGQIDDARAVEPLIKALGAGNSYAAWALGEIADARAVEPLIKALDNDDYDVYLSVMKALGKTGDERAVDPLIKVLEDDDERARREGAAWALDALGWEPDTEELLVVYLITKQGWDECIKLGEPTVEALIKVLEDDDERARREGAAWALGEIGDARAVEPLIKELRDGSAYLLARALGEIGDARAVEPLIKILGDGTGYNFDTQGVPWQVVYCSVIEALGKIGDARAVEPLIKALDNDDPDVQDVCCSAMEALGKIGDVQAVGPLTRLFSHANPRVCSIAIEALGTLGEPAVEQLFVILGAEDNAERASAAKALGKTGDARAVEPLIKALGAGNSSAAWALGEIADARAVEPLIKVLDNDDYDVCFSAMEALGKIGDARALEPLIKVLVNGDNDSASHSAEALTKLEWEPETDELRIIYRIAKKDVAALVKLGGIAVEPLIEVLDDDDTRGLAIKVLTEIADERAEEPLKKAIVQAALKAESASDINPVMSVEEKEQLEKHCALLISDEKILNLEQKEFTQIIESWNHCLEEMEGLCSAEEIIALASGSSAKVRWIVACTVVEICCYEAATVDNLLQKHVQIFWSSISAYSNPITKSDRDELVRVLRGLPVVLSVHAGKGLYDFVGGGLREKGANDIVKENRKLISTVFEDPELAKAVLAGL